MSSKIKDCDSCLGERNPKRKQASSENNEKKSKKRYFLRKYMNEKLWQDPEISQIKSFLTKHKNNLLPEQERMMREDLLQIVNPETNILHGGVATGYYFFVSKTPVHKSLKEYLNETTKSDYASVCFNIFVRYECQENEKLVTKVRHFFKEHKTRLSKSPYPCFDVIYKGIDYNAQDYRLYVNEELVPFYIGQERPPLI